MSCSILQLTLIGLQIFGIPFWIESTLDMAIIGRRPSSDIELGEAPKMDDPLPSNNSPQHIEINANPIAGVQAALGNPMPM